MAYVRKRITKKEIKSISEDYLQELPGWRRLDANTLFRLAVPFAHLVSFERLSYGAYRPMFYIDLLANPRDYLAASFCLCYLPWREETCDFLAHEYKREAILNAMKTTVVPSAVKPLDAREVAKLALREAKQAVREGIPVMKIYSMAIVHAWYGDERACKQMSVAYENALNAMCKSRESWPSGCDQEVRFLNESVIPWLEEGVARQELEAIVRSRLQKEGFPEADE